MGTNGQDSIRAKKRLNTKSDPEALILFTDRVQELESIRLLKSTIH